LYGNVQIATQTLAFLVPALEALWRQKWSQGDGLGALVVVPTRELAIQIFDVLRLVGKHHSISAGLLIGGKKEFFEEQKRVVGMSLLVATPGRLLQHLEQTPGFEVGSLQV
jgi:ATP-dependent RNA helicase DDX10/DBP4